MRQVARPAGARFVDPAPGGMEAGSPVAAGSAPRSAEQLCNAQCPMTARFVRERAEARTAADEMQPLATCLLAARRVVQRVSPSVRPYAAQNGRRTRATVGSRQCRAPVQWAPAPDAQAALR